MKRSRPELPSFVRVGASFKHIRGCECPTPGEYVVYRVGASRKMAWARNGGCGEAILRAHDFRTYGERYELAAEPEKAS